MNKLIVNCIWFGSLPDDLFQFSIQKHDLILQVSLYENNAKVNENVFNAIFANFDVALAKVFTTLREWEIKRGNYKELSHKPNDNFYLGKAQRFLQQMDKNVHQLFIYGEESSYPATSEMDLLKDKTRKRVKELSMKHPDLESEAMFKDLADDEMSITLRKI